MLGAVRWVIAPLLGGVIGYITNDLAIRMLFRPRRAVYIGRFHVPFTPGLIPSQKSRIADSIGAVISQQLLNTETLEQALLSEEVTSTLRRKLTGAIEKLGQEEFTLREKLLVYVREERLEHYETKIRDRGAALIVERLVDADIGGVIVESAVHSIREKRGIGLLAGMIDDKAMQSLKKELGGRIHRMIETRGAVVIADEIESLEDDILSRRLNDLYAEYGDRIPSLIDHMTDAYQGLVKDNLGRVLRTVNISQIVADRIHSFSEEELENLILGIMKKELRAIVYLGAVLGSLMGFLNLLL